MARGTSHSVIYVGFFGSFPQQRTQCAHHAGQATTKVNPNILLLLLLKRKCLEVLCTERFFQDRYLRLLKIVEKRIFECAAWHPQLHHDAKVATYAISLLI